MVLSVVLIVGTRFGFPVATVASAAVMACLVSGWALLLGLPSHQGTTAVLGVGAVAVLVGGSLFAQDGLLWLSASVALVTLLAFVHQLARGDGRPQLVESISASVTGIVLLASGASLLPAIAAPAGRSAVLVVLAAVLAAAMADVGGRWGLSLRTCAVASVILGGGAAAAVAAWAVTGGPAPALAALVGGLAGGASHAVRQVNSVLPRMPARRAQLASAAASVLAVGLFTHVATWLSTLLK